jgi:23S rRNA (cytosine1962-C5)-methyltransferase
MIALKEGKQKSVLNHHPWLFTGALDNIERPSEARIDKVCDSAGHFLAWGYYDGRSHIPVHIMSWNESEQPDEDWWAAKVKESILRRRSFFEQGKSAQTTAFRIIHGEADFLGGLTCDVYGTVVRVIISSRLAYMFKDAAIGAIEALLHPSLAILNTDPAFCSAEGLPKEIEYYRLGEKFTPQEKLDPIRIRESGLLYELVPGTGQKSGFYCDQRENRNIVEQYCTGKTVMDGCSYSGAFTLHALRAGAASVDAFDSSEDALHMLLANVNMNEEAGNIPELSRAKVTVTKCDIFEQIRQIPDDKYDVIILDPPKLASTKSAADKAKRAYKDLNRIAMEKIRNGGILVSCSCSGAITHEDFKTVLGWAAKDACASAQILHSLSQGPDHPILVSFPESEYLKVFVMRIIR